ncbi:MAG: hypothetical protein ACPLF9_08790, partial [Methanothermobacter tenebrarum]
PNKIQPETDTEANIFGYVLRPGKNWDDFSQAMAQAQTPEQQQKVLKAYLQIIYIQDPETGKISCFPVDELPPDQNIRLVNYLLPTDTPSILTLTPEPTTPTPTPEPTATPIPQIKVKGVDNQGNEISISVPDPRVTNLVAVEQTTTHELTTNLQMALQTVLKDMGVAAPDVSLRIKVEMRNMESDQPLANLISYVRDEIIKQVTSAPVEYNRFAHNCEITLRVEAPAKIPTEKLKTELLSQDILSVLSHKLVERELQAKVELDETLEKMESDIKKTLAFTEDVENSIREFLALAADTIAVGAFVYQLVLWIIRKKRQEYLGANKTLVGRLANEQLSKLLDFFSVVPKSRITEISEGTGIPPERAKLLMKAFCFEHETACFWHPPTINDQVFRNAAKTHRLSIWKWTVGLWLERHKRLAKVLLIGGIGVGVYY